MTDFHFYPEKYRKKLNENYIAQFLKQASAHYLETNHSRGYIIRSLHSMSLFGDWLELQQISLTSVVSQHVEMFLNYAKTNLPKRSIGTEILRRQKAKYAVSLIHKQFPQTPDVSFLNIEVARYVNYLREQRELAESTIAIHKKKVTEFLQHFFPKRKISIKSIKPEQVLMFFQSATRTPKDAKRKILRFVLKGYFQYVETCGVPTRHLISAIPLISTPRRAASPCLVTEKELKILLKTTGDTSCLGKRAQASILCLYDLGIRIGDVTRINLDDIDWRNGTIRIANHKTSMPFHLPMSQRLGDALAAYIKDARLRISELLALNDKDVDWSQKTLIILGSKKLPMRLVPLDRTVLNRLKQYMKCRDRAFPNRVDDALFLSVRGTRFSYSAISHAWFQLRLKTDTGKNAHRLPRLHDFRHTFACNHLMKAYSEHKDLDRAVHLLSVYLGHCSITKTYWYLTGIPQLLEMISARVENHINSIRKKH